ncbi:DUF3131 domain-containing protein [Candidatus Parcubacteria bacterium]|nr:MAG: DUF3131 domain-containing protein [Candidatus Parcubacteria bacterium]
MRTEQHPFLMSRHHITFLLGLALAFAIAWSVERQIPKAIKPHIENFSEVLHITPQHPQPAKPRALTAREMEWAREAWHYFEHNYQPATGMVNSVAGYPSTSMWDLGSYLMGAIAARELELIDEGEFENRVGRLLDSLTKMPLVEGWLPNKAYNTITLEMTDYNNNPTRQGVGWTAIDIARFGVPMQIIVWRHPRLAPKVKRVIQRWRLEKMVDHGHLVTAERGVDGKLYFFQEGRFGYEQYAAQALSFLGLDVAESARFDLNVKVRPVEGQPIAYDARLPRHYHGTHNAVLSEPYILTGAEFGFNSITLPLAQSVLQAQINRFENSGILTAVSEDHIDRAPWFVYNSVLNDLKPWAAFTPDGRDASQFRCLSTKAAIGWGLLFEGEYSSRLLQAVENLRSFGAGWYAGKYEQTGQPNRALTSNTNAVILEVLAARAKGPLMKLATLPASGDGH